MPVSYSYNQYRLIYLALQTLLIVTKEWALKWTGGLDGSEFNHWWSVA